MGKHVLTVKKKEKEKVEVLKGTQILTYQVVVVLLGSFTSSHVNVVYHC